jgi:hypothetical protein
MRIFGREGVSSTTTVLLMERTGRTSRNENDEEMRVRKEERR